MFDLQEQTILITRPEHKAQAMADLIRKRNGRPVLFPTIQIAPPENWESVDQAIQNLSDFDWVIFTSANGVRFFLQRIREIADLSIFSKVKVGVVGSKTAHALREAGITVDLVPSNYTSEKLLDTLTEISVQNHSFLLVLGDKARHTLSDGLIAAGAKIHSVITYRNIKEIPKNVDSIFNQLRNGDIRVLTFTSPSTFMNFFEMITEISEDSESLIHGQTLAAIGPVTAQAIQESGFPVAIVPEESTIEGMLDAIASYFKTQTKVNSTEL